MFYICWFYSPPLFMLSFSREREIAEGREGERDTERVTEKDSERGKDGRK